MSSNRDAAYRAASRITQRLGFLPDRNESIAGIIREEYERDFEEAVKENPHTIGDVLRVAQMCHTLRRLDVEVLGDAEG
jgi:hypothetical protein